MVTCKKNIIIVLLLAIVAIPATTFGATDIGIDGHWIEFRGEKVLLIGDSVTQGWFEGGSNFNYQAYVDALASRNINVLMIWSYMATSASKQIGDSRIGYDAPEYWPWAGSSGSFDLTTFNPTYFTALENLVSYANSKDIVVLICIHDGWTKTLFSDHPFYTGNGGPLTSNSQYVEFYNYYGEMGSVYNASWNYLQKNQYFQERFTNEIINAVGSYPNVMLEICNEGEWYNQTNYRAYTVHLLDYIKARTDCPTVVNDDHIGGTNFLGEANCDIIDLHKPLWNSGTDAYDFFVPYTTSYWGTPSTPQFFGEPVRSDSPAEWRGESTLIDPAMRMMWGTALSAAGFVLQNDASFGFDPYANMAAEAYDWGVMVDRIGHCATLLNDSGINLGAMWPDGSVTSTGVCLHSSVEFVVYSQSGSSFTVNLSSAGSQTLDCRFYNPRTGVFNSIFQRTGGSTAELFTKPDSSDWVLHIAGEISNAPVIQEVTPDPDTDSFAGVAYTKQLQLSSGATPITWSVVQGPSGIQVDSSGYVYGWTPGGCDAGNSIAIEIRAQNAEGSDTETWQVQPKEFYLQDSVLDFIDLAIMCDEWLLTGGNLATDLDCSSNVDFYDYAIFAEEWASPPPPDLVISNLSPGTYEVSYDDLDVGELLYIDRTYTYTSVPAAYQNKTYIKTSNEDKDGSPNNSITFDVNREVAVYVAHDDRITTKPSWLGSFTDTGDNIIESSESRPFSLYEKVFPAGTVNLYENGGSGASYSMYTVVVIEQ